MLANTGHLDDERRSKTFSNMFGTLQNPKEKLEANASKERSTRKSHLFKQNRLKRQDNKQLKKEDVKMESIKDEKSKNKNSNTICCNICKNLINLDEYHRKVNPFMPVRNLTDNLLGHKNDIDKILKKIEIMKKEPLKRRDLVDTILLDKWNKKWGRAIVKENGKSFVYQVKKTWRGKYVVSLERNKPVDYKVFYEKFKYKGLLKGKENIIVELRNRYEVRNKARFEDSHYNSSNDAKMFSN